jgi:hypothetical protein
MARRGRHQRGGRTTPKGTRPLGDGRRDFHLVGGEDYPWEVFPQEVFFDEVDEDGFPDDGDEDDLLATIEGLLAAGDPVDLLTEISGLVAVVDPRSQNPMERDGESEAGLSLTELVDAFAAVDRLETTALLAGIAQLGFDERARKRAARLASRRRHPLPGWLTRLDEAVAYRAVEMGHVLGDGDDVIIGVRLPYGHELSVLVYIDHNLGTAAKDGFIVSQPLDTLIDLMKTHDDDPGDTEWRELSLADARFRAEEAVRFGSMVFPPLESDSWPLSRPMVEWALRLMPEGGTGYYRPEWTDADRQELTDDFFASEFAERVRGESYRDLFESILWFGCDYGPGDPLRWSPVSVDMLLIDWIPRNVVAGVGFLSKAPDLLRAFIRYSHHRRGVRPGLTEETIAAVDAWEPEYQRLIRSPRPQGPYALLAAMGALDPDSDWDLPEIGAPIDMSERMLANLRNEVGGDEVLWNLDTSPLPDEEFAWDGVPDDVRPVVEEVVRWCDRCCNDLLDVEYRTACRRFLFRASTGDPRVFRRRARTDTAAAAVCWTIGKANDLFTPTGGGMLVKDLAGYFGLQQSGFSTRASTLVKAAGIPDDYGWPLYRVALGTPDLLVSSRRQKIIELRDDYAEKAAD